MTTGPEAVLRFIKYKPLGHSFTGNALSCAAACASLDIFEKESTWKNIKRIEQANLAYQVSILDNNAVFNSRVLGTILAIELETGEGNTYFSNIRDKAYNFFLEQGLLIRPLGNVIFINPPYCISNEQLASIYKAFDSFLTLIQKEKAIG